jgi:hypothetical protein
VVFRLGADLMMILENKKLKTQIYNVMVYIRGGLKHIGRNWGETYLMYVMLMYRYSSFCK